MINKHGLNSTNLHSFIYESVIDQIMINATDEFGDKRHKEAYTCLRMYDIFIMHDCNSRSDKDYTISNLNIFLERDDTTYFKPSYCIILFLMNRVLQYETASIIDLINLKRSFDLKKQYGPRYRKFFDDAIQMLLKRRSEYSNIGE